MDGSVDTRQQGLGKDIVTQRTKRESKSRKDTDCLYAKKSPLCADSKCLTVVLPYLLKN